ncbi:ABC transporter substrate-binding protein [Neisseriaceae bacterium TC5R-5]|nr:ABC transporter substrate-binding protein [Neisseriaceae bacterium TC5R-5]
MLTKRLGLTLCLLGGLLALPLQASQRLVVMTPDIAEIVVALGAAAQVVGRDRGSSATSLAQAQVIGFSRSLNAETIARLRPTLVLGSAAAQPASIWQQLTQLHIPNKEVSSREDGSDFAAAIRTVGKLLAREGQANTIAERWQQQMQPRPATGRRYLISYDGRLVAGKDTAADTLIRAAGGVNVASGFSGFKPLNRAAWQALQADVIILGSHTAAIYGGKQGFAQRPEIASTPAGKQGRIYTLAPQQAFLLGLNSPAIVEQLVTM